MNKGTITRSKQRLSRARDGQKQDNLSAISTEYRPVKLRHEPVLRRRARGYDVGPLKAEDVLVREERLAVDGHLPSECLLLLREEHLDGHVVAAPHAAPNLAVPTSPDGLDGNSINVKNPKNHQRNGPKSILNK